MWNSNCCDLKGRYLWFYFSTLNCFEELTIYLEYQKRKEKEMATSSTDNFESYIKGLLQCPICFESIKSAPIHQCTNGHIFCVSCITKLKNCPICRSNSPLCRSLAVEKIIENCSKLQLKSEKNFDGPEMQKWGQESTGVHFSSNGSNEESSVQLNLNSVERGGSDNGTISILDGIKKGANCLCNFFCIFLLASIFTFLAIAVVLYIVDFFYKLSQLWNCYF